MIQKENEKCVKCGTNNWRRKLIGFRNVYQCKKCGYVFDWLNYIETGRIDASGITTKKLSGFLDNFIGKY